MPDINQLTEKGMQLIIDADEQAAIEFIDEVYKKDKSLIPALSKGFVKGNEAICAQFDKGRISIVELIYSSEIMKSVLQKILNLTGYESSKEVGKILIATVEGDVHDIGKGIVASTLKMAGFEVIDLGREVSVKTIVEAAEKHKVDIIGTSALLTSTLSEQKKLENLLRDLGIRDKYKTIVGGAPCTKRWAEKIGADAYCIDAFQSVQIAKNLLYHNSKY